MMTDSKKNIADALVLLISSLNRKIFNPHELMKNFPVPPSHARVIFYLKGHGPARISQVARDLGISKPNMTPIIDKLIMEGLVRRYDDPSDRRVVKVEITGRANELFEKREEYMREIIAGKVSLLSDEELSELDGLIAKMTAMIDKLN